jgi:acyl-coenzyme A thioesterase 13
LERSVKKSELRLECFTQPWPLIRGGERQRHHPDAEEPLFRPILSSLGPIFSATVDPHLFLPSLNSSLVMAAPANDPELLSFVQDFWAARLPHSAIYQLVLSGVVFTHVSKGLVRARITLTKDHVNSHGGIHGSTSATMFDWVGGMAIAAWDKRTKTGVSTDIHVTYQSSAREGDEIEIEGVATKVGGTLAFTRCCIYKVVDGERGPVIAEGSHTKYVKV